MFHSTARALLALAMLALAAPALAVEPVAFPIGLGSASFATVAARIAGELGLFLKHGLAARFIVMDRASAATTALIAGSVAGADRSGAGGGVERAVPRTRTSSTSSARPRRTKPNSRL